MYNQDENKNKEQKMVKNLLILYWIRAIIAFRARMTFKWNERIENIFGCEVQFFMNPECSTDKINYDQKCCIAEFVMNGKLIEMGCVVDSKNVTTKRFLGSWDEWEKLDEPPDPLCENPSPYSYLFDTSAREQNQTSIFNIAKNMETPKLSLS